METVAIVKTSKPTYNAYSFTKHKKVYLTAHSKTSLTQSIKKSTRMYSNVNPGAINLVWMPLHGCPHQQ